MGRGSVDRDPQLWFRDAPIDRPRAPPALARRGSRLLLGLAAHPLHRILQLAGPAVGAPLHCPGREPDKTAAPLAEVRVRVTDGHDRSLIPDRRGASQGPQPAQDLSYLPPPTPAYEKAARNRDNAISSPPPLPSRSWRRATPRLVTARHPRGLAVGCGRRMVREGSAGPTTSLIATAEAFPAASRIGVRASFMSRRGWSTGPAEINVR